jgi:hypothetical protein
VLNVFIPSLWFLRMATSWLDEKYPSLKFIWSVFFLFFIRDANSRDKGKLAVFDGWIFCSERRKRKTI